MATADKTFAWTMTAENWSFTSAGDGVGAFQSGDGNPVGCLEMRLDGESEADAGHYEWTGTWEDLGVPAGATVIALEMRDTDSKCTEWINVDDLDLGAFQLLESDETPIGMLWAGRQNISAVDAKWQKAGAQTAVSGFSHASDTSIRLRLNWNADTGKGPGTGITIRFDNLDLTITYRTTYNTRSYPLGVGLGIARRMTGTY